MPRLLRIALWVLMAVPLLAGTAWWTLALIYAGPGPAWMRGGLALIYVGGTIAVLRWVHPLRWALGVWVAGFVLLLGWWISIPARNDRDWAPDVARLPSVEIRGDLLTFHNVRNFDYRTENDFTPRYEDRTVDLTRLRGLDLFMVYWGSPMIAHTIMSWQFEGAPSIAISIETRKQRGQQYSAVEGFFKQYELIYVVADERDVIRLRTNYRGEQVFLYRLTTPLPQARALLLDYVAVMNTLVRHPKFYNAILDNCTTSIRRHAKRINPDAPPFDWRLIANGYGDQLMYERRVLDTSLPFADLRVRSLINARARAADQDPAFSTLIRDGLPDPRSPQR
jgi:hypothetical protein